jgi:tetratricopeptide (TPR) repeat protein
MMTRVHFRSRLVLSLAAALPLISGGPAFATGEADPPSTVGEGAPQNPSSPGAAKTLEPVGPDAVEKPGSQDTTRGAEGSDARTEARKGETPVAPDTPEIRTEILKDLYTHLAAAKDADTAAAIAGQIERIWFVSGSDTVDLLMQRALKALAEGKLALALDLFTAVTKLQPDYAEGWNRRAFVYYRMEDVERSLGDLRRALALEPKHYKALEGLANILRQEGSKKNALEAMRKLTEIHPHLPGIKETIEELTREVEGQGI